ncbi:MAG: DUF2461 domain-containing protein [Pseudomonadota bacterium]
MSGFAFDPSILAFLDDLSANNNRTWFEENKQRFKTDVQGQLVAIVEALAPKLADISPHIIADPRPNGKTIFRIYRDVRFSKDKRPYKEHAACHFRHASEQDVHGPGFYFHIDREGIVLGAGVWAPPSDDLRAIRQHIVDQPKAWAALKAENGLGILLDGFEADRLKTAPRGFPKDHEHVEDLKRKSFVVSQRLPREAVTGPDLIDSVAKAYCSCAPANAFICTALGLPF